MAGATEHAARREEARHALITAIVAALAPDWVHISPMRWQHDEGHLIVAHQSGGCYCLKLYLCGNPKRGNAYDNAWWVGPHMHDPETAAGLIEKYVDELRA